MKKTLIILVLLVAVAGMISVSAFNRNMDDVVGYIDGNAVKAAELQSYVDTLLGDNYRKKMDSKEGRKELFNHYVNRKLLLEYAKENVEEGDSFVTSHTMGNVSTESAMLSAVLKKEVNDKVKYTEEDIRELMASDVRFSDAQSAERELISQKRLKLFYTFMNKLKAEHKIELAG
ncbi:hypothetical protein Dacet_1015 [Denitrovibrio acetiphilus DSM 12809]|uniref:Peptidylprolyl isomerase n=1 Tax=Denitrovibrio acetiphilus (strain DSM 12809 / NBRC 114555 / N2460) TaxID=522772 RepID=D4H6S5_DENA2|nr:hypothetical protein [Denitrovibrio acetiphilus]ADD67791.1 hypothetical protein Dacet_1015 [Denitrovibrio acetiphilus DSM 12809]